MSTIRRLLWIWAITGWWAPAARGESSDPIEAGQRALQSSASYPWYDAEQDSIRPVSIRSTEGDVANRQSDWDQTYDWEWNWHWPDWLRFPASLLEFFLYVLITLIFAGVVVLLIAAVRRMRSDMALEGELNEDEDVETRGDVDRIEALPIPELRQRGDLLEAARQARQAQRYDEAIVYYFSYLLVQLDRAQFVRLTRGKTNRQYLHEVGARTATGQILESTMVAFEDVYFGRHTLDGARFEACWSRLDESRSLTKLEATT